MGFILTFFALITGVIFYCANVVLLSFIIWMAVDAAKQDRFWWMVLIIGVPIVGAGAYYFTEKKHEYAKVGSHHIHKSETEEQHETSPKARTRQKKDKNTINEEPVILAEEPKENERV